MAEVGGAVAASVPVRLVAIYDCPLLVLVGAKFHIVKDEELCFGAKVRFVGDAALAKILFGFAGDVARVAGIWVAPRAGLGDIADEAEGWLGGKGVHDGCRGIGDEQHIALVDLLEAANAGPIEADAFAKEAFVENANRHAKMLPGTRNIGKLEVNHPDALFLGKPDYLFRCRRHAMLPEIGRAS